MPEQKKIKIDNMKGVFIAGDNSGTISNTINEAGTPSNPPVDMKALAEELLKLRAAMKEAATDVEHDEAVGDIAKAEKSAREDNYTKVLEHLKAAGNWALEVATSIGSAVAVAAIKEALGV